MKPSRLEPNTDHSWSRDGRNYWTCGNRGCTAREFSPDGGPEVSYACEGGLKKGELDRGSGPAPYSTSNSEGVAVGTALASWVRDQPCLVSGKVDHGCRGDVIAHHVLSRGSGHGDWRVTGDGRVKGNLVPLCDRAHREVHSDGIRTFEDRYDIGTLESWAKHYGREFPGEPPESVKRKAELEAT